LRHRADAGILGHVIKSFADAETARIWSGRRSRRLPLEIQPLALRELRTLNQARRLADLRVPPGNRLERPAGRAARPVQHPDQPAVADLLPVA
jgi:proteic killer suppression protein